MMRPSLRVYSGTLYHLFLSCYFQVAGHVELTSKFQGGGLSQQRYAAAAVAIIRRREEVHLGIIKPLPRIPLLCMYCCVREKQAREGGREADRGHPAQRSQVGSSIIPTLSLSLFLSLSLWGDSTVRIRGFFSLWPDRRREVAKHWPEEGAQRERGRPPIMEAAH